MYKQIFFILIVKIFLVKSEIHPIVQTQNGVIRGTFNEGFISFFSIPYAEPPIGENRFESPKPIDKNWTEILDCTKIAEDCIQWNHFIFKKDRLSGSENCLYLNVHAPALKNSKLFPVIVFIHGGAFQYGGANIFRPDLILKDNNAVIVTIAYRLGPLGFLSTGDEELPGNLGLKDQRLALKWIKANIQNFGGNPDNITLTGFSAGGTSVHLHLLTENIENLISTAISFSGTAFCPWALVNNPIEKTKILASLLNCTTENSKVLKTCLKNKAAEDIVRHVGNFQMSHYFPFRIFGPVIENSASQDPFLNEDPLRLIEMNKTGKIPWMVAYTSNDGGYNAADLMQKQNGVEYIEKFWENFDDFAPIALFYDELLNRNESIEYSKFLKQKYNIKNEDTNLEKYFKIQDLFTDELFAKGSLKAIELHKDFADSPVYGYVYDNPSPLGIGNLISQRYDIDFGCTHGDDVFLMFNVPHRDAVPFRDDELELSKKFIEMLKTFSTSSLAKFGNVPFPKNKKNEKVQLLKITKDSASSEVYNDITSNSYQ